MKTPAILIALTMVSCGALEAMDAPFVDVHTVASGHKDILSTTSNGESQSQAQGSIGITIDYNFFKPVVAPFEIQCFFVARNEATKKRYIYDVVRLSQTTPAQSMTVRSAPLVGDTTKWHTTPWDLVTSSGNIYSLTSSTTTQITGSKIEGWIVRFMANKSVLCLYSNQSFLKEQAARSPEILNQLAEDTKPATFPAVANSTPAPAAPATKPAPTVAPAAEPLGTVGLFVGKSWTSDAGTRWTFLRGGLGEKAFGKNVTSFSWKEVEPGLVEITGRNRPDTPTRLWYVHFLSESEANYGDARDRLKYGMHWK